MDINNLVKMLIGNPQQIISKTLGNTPMSNNLSNMIVNRDENGLEQMARNLAKEKGADADKIYSEVKSKLGLN